MTASQSVKIKRQNIMKNANHKSKCCFQVASFIQLSKTQKANHEKKKTKQYSVGLQ